MWIKNSQNEKIGRDLRNSFLHCTCTSAVKSFLPSNVAIGKSIVRQDDYDRNEMGSKNSKERGKKISLFGFKILICEL